MSEHTTRDIVKAIYENVHIIREQLETLDDKIDRLNLMLVAHDENLRNIVRK